MSLLNKKSKILTHMFNIQLDFLKNTNEFFTLF